MQHSKDLPQNVPRSNNQSMNPRDEEIPELPFISLHRFRRSQNDQHLIRDLKANSGDEHTSVAIISPNTSLKISPLQILFHFCSIFWLNNKTNFDSNKHNTAGHFPVRPTWRTTDQTLRNKTVKRKSSLSENFDQTAPKFDFLARIRARWCRTHKDELRNKIRRRRVPGAADLPATPGRTPLARSRPQFPWERIRWSFTRVHFTCWKNCQVGWKFWSALQARVNPKLMRNFLQMLLDYFALI